MGGLPLSRRRGRSDCGGGGLLQVMTIQQPATPTDGETKPTWSTLATNVPCERTYRRGREVLSGSRVIGLSTEQVRFRFRADVTSRCRFRFATTSGTDDVLEILSVGDPMGNRSLLVADCNRLEST